MFKLKLSIDPVQVKLKSTVYTAVPRKVVIQRRNSVLNNFGEELWVILPSHCELQSNLTKTITTHNTFRYCRSLLGSLRKTTTSINTGTLLNQRFNEQNNGCARAL